jgi:hypothetical protein
MVHEDIQKVLSMNISDPVEKENLHNKLKNNFMVTVKVIAVVDDHGDNVKNVMNGIKGTGALDSCNWSRFPFISKEFICANNLERFIVAKPKSNIVLGDRNNQFMKMIMEFQILRTKRKNMKKIFLKNLN